MTAPAGKEFDGWKAGGTTYARGDSYTVKGNVVFTAQWKDTAPQSFTVTFDSDGGTPPQTTKTVDSPGGTVGALPPAPTKTGYVFDNWHTEKNGAGSQFTAATPVTANITVYANWKGESFTVTFDSDGGTPAQTPKTVANSGGTVDALPTAPTKTGYTFDNWHTEKNGAGTQFTAATPVTANITVYANWKEENPLVGGVWMDPNQNTHYKFTDTPHATVSNRYVYSTKGWNGNDFNVAGYYDIKENKITLRPDNGGATEKSYEIINSLLILEKGKAGEARYTRNPETGGGFNGEPAAAPLGGIWQDNAATTSYLGFNNKGEYFSLNIQNNNKFWWDVSGTYELNGNELIFRRYTGTGTTQESADYNDISFGTGNMTFTLRKEGIAQSVFHKRTQVNL
jgi:uncharacterized repeat protein (TIGR02543 family)